MTESKRECRVLLLCAILAACAALPRPCSAGYEIVWQSIDAGGGTSSAGQYVLTATIGQPDAAWSKGGSFEILGGFLPGGPMCIVEFDDFARFAQYWLQSSDTADLNSDLSVDFLDVQLLADHWLAYCPYGWQLK